MLETRILPLLVLDIMEEFMDDIPEVSTELAGLWQSLLVLQSKELSIRSVVELARELLCCRRVAEVANRSRDLDLESLERWKR